MQEPADFHDMSSNPGNIKNYCLLNKDQRIAAFHVDVLTQVITIDKQYVQLPEWFGELDVFIQNRRAPKQRENIEKLLQLSGCDICVGRMCHCTPTPLMKLSQKQPLRGDFMEGSLAQRRRNTARTDLLQSAGYGKIT